MDAPTTAHGVAKKWTPRVRRASRGPFEECWFGPWGCLPGLLAAWNRLRMGQSGQSGTMKAWEGPTKNGLLGRCTSLSYTHTKDNSKRQIKHLLSLSTLTAGDEGEREIYSREI